MLLALLLLSVEPDLSGMLKLSSGNTIAHGCPIAMDKALTNRHVVDGHSTIIWGTGDGEQNHGILKTDSADEYRDLAYVSPATAQRFPQWYPLAAEAPKVGDKVFFLGYDFKNPDEAFGPKRFKGVVTRIFNGNLVFDPAGKPGTSGSCILNEKGEVVAINQGGKETDNQETAGIGVGVWGDWLKLKPDEPEPQEYKIRLGFPFPWGLGR
jgi:S1-C subfamily serine protease